MNASDLAALHHRVTVAGVEFTSTHVEQAFEVVNLTQHVVTVLATGGDVAAAYPPSGSVARLEATYEPSGHVGGAPVGALRYGHVIGLPEPQPGVLYLVSILVKLQAPNRPDVAVVADEVRDEAGRIIGCRGLATEVLVER